MVKERQRKPDVVDTWGNWEKLYEDVESIMDSE